MITRKRLPKYVSEFQDRHGNWHTRFRRKGHKDHYFKSVPWSPEFMQEYQACLAGDAAPKPEIGKARSAPGSMSALIADYYRSSLFTALESSTQATYRGQLERFREKHGNKPVKLMETKHIDSILGEEAAKSRSMASNLRKRLATLMQCAVKWDYRKDNPMLQVDRIKYRTPGIRTWTDDDIALFRARWEEGTPQRIAFEILLYTGLRRSDAVRLGRQHIRGDWIAIGTKKSGQTVQLEIPIHPDFRAFLDKIKHGNLTFIVTGRGAGRTEQGFTNWIIEAARDAGLPPKSSPHGVRKAACRTLAEAGCSATQIMSITGHRDIKEIELYCRAADRKKQAAAAIAKVMGESRT